MSSPARRGALSSAERSPRLIEVDLVRGLLILLMCSTHALTLARVDDGSWLYGALPRGWATHGFVILSGFTLSYVIDALYSPRRLRWAIKRGAQLCVVAVVSNVLFGLAGAGLGSSTSLLSSPAWWVEHVMGPDYSLSAVLFPTAALLFLLPLLSYGVRTLGVHAMLVASVSMTLVAGYLTQQTYAGLGTLLVNPGLGDFPLLLMTAEGVTGCILGAWVMGRRWTTAAVVAVACLAVLALGASGPLVGLRALGRLFLIAALAILWSRTGVLRALREGLAMVGRFPLMAFLGHRVAIQIAAIVLVSGAFAPQVRYLALLLAALGAVWAWAMLRVRYPAVDGAWRSIWL